MVEQDKIINFINKNSFIISTGIVFVFSFLLLLLTPLWMLLVVIGIIGGFINRGTTLKDFSSGFLGMLVAELLFFNFQTFKAVEAVDLLMSTIGVSGIGLFAFILILFIWSSFVGLGSIIGSSCFILFKQLIMNKKNLMVKEFDS